MSIKVNIVDPDKKQLANLLRAIAEHIEVACNQTVTCVLEVTFDSKKAKDC